jgi:hypothetical protein
MYYTIYKITNQIDGKIYIGSHKTKDLNDSYMGSGKYLKHAIEKHGIENFTKDILFVFDTPEEMYAKEADIVNDDFLALENTYNLKTGGFGGFDYINEQGLQGFTNTETAKLGRSNTNQILENKYGPNWRSLYLSPERRVAASKKAAETKKRRGYKSNTNQMNTQDAVERKKQKFKETRHQQGDRNSQYGKIWITDGVSSKSIFKDDSMPDGWYRGRVITSKNSY